MKITGPVYRRHVNQGQTVATGFDELGKPNRFFDLAGVAGMERALAQAQSPVDYSTDQQRPVI